MAREIKRGFGPLSYPELIELYEQELQDIGAIARIKTELHRWIGEDFPVWVGNRSLVNKLSGWGPGSQKAEQYLQMDQSQSLVFYVEFSKLGIITLDVYHRERSLRVAHKEHHY